MIRDDMLFRLMLAKAAIGGEPLYEYTVTGNPASFETGVAKTLKEMEVQFSPGMAGSGEPSPTNVRNITGYTGLNVYVSGTNLWNEDWEVGSINGSTGQNTPDSGSFRSKGYIPVVPGLQYYLYYELPGGATPSSNIRLFYYDQDKNFLSVTWASKQVYTVPSGVFFLRFYGDSKFGAQNDHVSFNYPSSNTTYNEYYGKGYPVAFGQGNAVYGGTLDVITGVMSVEFKMWTANTADMNRDSDNYPGWNQCGIKDIIGPGFDGTLYAGPSDAHYMNCGTAMGVNTDGNADNVFLSYSRYGLTEAEWKALAIDVQFLYHLETPETLQIDPVEIETLFGDNVILTTTYGSNTVVYLDNIVIDQS